MQGRWNARRILRRPFTAAMVVLTASACSGAGTARTSVVGQSQGGEPVCPLTGKPFARGVDANRPAVAVKVENSPEARPQSGLNAADLVYEEPVEGGLAWFVAVFHCSDAALVGPVRSAHPADAAILATHTPAVFAHDGATPAVSGDLKALQGLRQVDARLSADAFQRVDGRAVPHNLYVSMPKLRALAKSGTAPRPWVTFRAPEPADKPKETPSASPSGRPTSGTSVQFTQGAASIRWTWDKAAGAYVRIQGSAPFSDSDGRPVTVHNVVFLWVTVTESETRDAAGNRTPILALTGRGEALVLHGGTEHSGRWVRQSLSEPPDLVDRKGRRMALAPGNSWIHLLPIDMPVFVR
jgi:Protein of unknown function (DUF3048) N-terminal domain/Protein of unknown function (DUF3048) C-terminal domain